MLSEKDYQLIGAFIDGEVSDEEKSQVQKRLLSDQEFNTCYQELKSLNMDIKSAYIQDDSEQPPEAFKAIVNQANSENNTSSLIWMLALAASVLGITLLSNFAEQSPENRFESLVQTEQFNFMLNNKNSQIKVTLSERANAVVMSTFKHTDGRYCREFQIQHSKELMHGVSCKQKDDWSVVVSKINASSDEHYQTATESNDPVEEFIQNFNGSDFINENVLIKSGWKYP